MARPGVDPWWLVLPRVKIKLNVKRDADPPARPLVRPFFFADFFPWMETTSN